MKNHRSHQRRINNKYGDSSFSHICGKRRGKKNCFFFSLFFLSIRVQCKALFDRCCLSARRNWCDAKWTPVHRLAKPNLIYFILELWYEIEFPLSRTIETDFCSIFSIFSQWYPWNDLASWKSDERSIGRKTYDRNNGHQVAQYFRTSSPNVSALKLAARKRNCQISFHVSRVLTNRRINLWYETIF